MNRNMRWIGILGFAIGLAASPELFAAGDENEMDAEQKQMAAEALEEAANWNKYQVKFHGTVYLRTPGDTDLAEDVLGRFVTSNQDRKPNRTYLMKLGAAGAAGAAVEAALKKLNGKRTQVTGALRVMDANGEAKYLLVQWIEVKNQTPTVPERRSAGGI